MADAVRRGAALSCRPHAALQRASYCGLDGEHRDAGAREQAVGEAVVQQPAHPAERARPRHDEVVAARFGQRRDRAPRAPVEQLRGHRHGGGHLVARLREVPAHLALEVAAQRLSGVRHRHRAAEAHPEAGGLVDDGRDGQQGVVGHRHVDRLVQRRPRRRRAVEGHEHAMHRAAAGFGRRSQERVLNVLDGHCHHLSGEMRTLVGAKSPTKIVSCQDHLRSVRFVR